MVKKAKSKRLRYTFNWIELYWYRTEKDGSKRVTRHLSVDDMSKTQRDSSKTHLSKVYAQIASLPLDDPKRFKNAIVKRIPTLWKGTTAKTRNSLDGRLRDIDRHWGVGPNNKDWNPLSWERDSISEAKGRQNAAIQNIYEKYFGDTK